MARGASGRRTDYIWNGTGVGLSISSGGSQLSDITGQFGAAGTIFRVRGELLASIDSPTDGAKVLITAGIIRITEEQLAVGITAVPNPLADLDADWLWHGFVPLMFVTPDAASGEAAGRLVIDSKAMRKMRQGELLGMVVDSNALTGTDAVDIVFGVRILFGN